MTTLQDVPSRMFVTVTTILDSRRFVGQIGDQVYEGVALPSTDGLVVGDSIIVRYLPNTTEILHVRRTATNLLCAPGRDPDTYQGLVFRLLTDGTWVELCRFGRSNLEDPSGYDDGALVSCIFWDNSTKKCYMIPFYETYVPVAEAPNPDPYDIYEIDLITGAKTGLGFGNAMRLPGIAYQPDYWNDPYHWCQQAVKAGDYWYIVGQRMEEYDAYPGYYYPRGVLFKFDPVGGILTVADSSPLDHDYSPVSAVGYDGTAIYWCYIDNDDANYIQIRRSTDGITFTTDHASADRTKWPVRHMKYNPVTERLQLGATDLSAPPGPTYHYARILYRTGGGSWEVDQDLSDIIDDPRYAVSIGFRYESDSAAEPIHEYVMGNWDGIGMPTKILFNRLANSTDVFAYESGISGGLGFCVYNPLASRGGRIWFLKTGYGMYYRDGDIGAWTGDDGGVDWTIYDPGGDPAIFNCAAWGMAYVGLPRDWGQM